MSDATDGTLSDDSPSEERLPEGRPRGRRIIKIRQVPVDPRDDPKAMEGVKQAAEPRNSKGNTKDGDADIFVVPEEAKQDHALQARATEAAKKRTERERTELIEQRDAQAAGPLTAEKITQRTELIQQRREGLEEVVSNPQNWLDGLSKDLQTVDNEADDKTPMWRFCVKVVIKVLERVRS